MTRLGNRSQHSAARAAAGLVFISVFVACGSFYPGPLFEPAKLPADAQNDSATLQEMQAVIHARYGADPKRDDAMLSDCRRRGSPAVLRGGTTTTGVGEVAISAAYVPPKKTPAEIYPHVSSLPPQALEALLGGSDDTRRSPPDVEDMLAKITKAKKAAPAPDYGKPRYAVSVVSQIFTNSPYDRFHKIETLLVLDAATAPKARIGSFESTKDSELEVKFGQVTRQEDTSLKLTGNVSSPIPGAGTGEVSGEYAKTWSEKLVRDLAEKITTTNVYRDSTPALADRSLWIVQRGHPDHKLTHTLSQVFNVDLTKVGAANGVPESRWWKPNKKKKLELTQGFVPLSTFRLRFHAFSLGVVRHIRSEKTGWIANEEHTVEEGDDKTRDYAITNYQHLPLPVARPAVRHVRVQVPKPAGGHTQKHFTVWQPVPTQQHPSVFHSAKDARDFANGIAVPGAWKAPVGGADWRSRAHATVMGVHVTLGSETDPAVVAGVLPGLHVWTE